MSCHAASSLQLAPLPANEINILLMGNPNVGKSVIFSKLTGMQVHSANYAGTTISYNSGKIKYREAKANLIDVPGTYSLNPSSPAEEVACRLLERGADVVLCVLDAANLGRNLPLALQVRNSGLPVVYALNMVDVAEGKGIFIDHKALAEELGGPVIPTAAVKNKGLGQLIEKTLLQALSGKKEVNQTSTAPDPSMLTELSPEAVEESWAEAERIRQLVCRYEKNIRPTLWQRFSDLTVRPWPGLPIAFLVLLLAMGLVVGGGKALRALILLPIFDGYVAPAITDFVSAFINEGIWRNVLVGDYGVLIKGIEWPIALILPYVSLFYVVMSFLEDCGYLPRLGVLLDNVMRKMGVQGSSVIPMFMGYGCAVPAILGTKAASTQKERLLITILVALAVPCTAQTAAFIVLLGDFSLFALIGVYLISLSALIIVGSTMSRLIPGKIDPMLMEIPELLMPDFSSLGKKIWLRIKQFLIEAELPILLGIAFAALIAETGALSLIAKALSPIVVGWLGLPAEASLALMLGIIRRELAVLPLLEMDLNLLQLMTGSVVALFYLPCLTVMAIIIKEFSVKFGLMVFAATILIALLAGGLLNKIGGLFM